ncbi:uncharacterized protein V1510DRAFT_408841 [Dipodascopsis tothii]|uniref:uncharacterized protein n=1 Tax=Dipodascopsis tothii TaxID=44089 RepID=UPI0034D00BBC
MSTSYMMAGYLPTPPPSPPVQRGTDSQRTSPSEEPYFNRRPVSADTFFVELKTIYPDRYYFTRLTILEKMKAAEEEGRKLSWQFNQEVYDALVEEYNKNDKLSVTIDPYREGKKSKYGESHTKRPCNNFVLYRTYMCKMFKKRAAELNKQNTTVNHRFISAVVAGLWATEDESVKNSFSVLQKIEKTKHSDAFEGYKYIPKTAQYRKKKSPA